MVKKRPCRICRVWFMPDARLGDKQHVCGQASCQQERHKRSCAQWNAREAPALIAARIRAQFAKASLKTSSPGKPVSLQTNFRKLMVDAAKLACEPMQDEMGGQVAEAMCIFARLVVLPTQDERRKKPTDIASEIAGHVGFGRQDEISIVQGSP